MYIYIRIYTCIYLTEFISQNFFKHDVIRLRFIVDLALPVTFIYLDAQRIIGTYSRTSNL